MLLKVLVWAFLALFVVILITQVTIPMITNKPVFPIFRKKALLQNAERRLADLQGELEAVQTEAEAARLEREIEELRHKTLKERARTDEVRYTFPDEEDGPTRRPPTNKDKS